MAAVFLSALFFKPRQFCLLVRRLVTSALRLLADAPLWGTGDAAQRLAAKRPNPTTPVNDICYLYDTNKKAQNF
jgi:hypothetical protein